MSSQPQHRPSPAPTHIGLVMASVWQRSRLPLDAVARRTGSDVRHITAVLAGERFPSRRFTDRYARVCGADPLVLLRIWEDEHERRRRSGGGRQELPGEGRPSVRR
ncbi:helix-turn-helix domain-containing protein [Streptomyces sp. NPDC051041]|uniref:helix-turn-helix domain-containing protein n=1 Tax=Streptomyces sp. NPDC051041 TaxID=3365640 RepID=UPI00378ADF13